MVFGNNPFRRFIKFIRGDKTPRQLTKALNMCSEKVLLELTDIGATTYMKYRIVLNTKTMRKKRHFPELYGFVCYWLSVQELYIRLKEDCYIYYRVKEDSGFEIRSGLLAVCYIGFKLRNLFNLCSIDTQLEGKFHLEVLFVDTARIGNEFLSLEYECFLNTVILDTCYTIMPNLKEMVRKIEKWLSSTKLEMEDDATFNMANMTTTVELAHQAAQDIISAQMKLDGDDTTIELATVQESIPKYEYHTNDAQKNLTKALNMCSERVLLELTTIGATTYIKYRIVLDKKQIKEKSELPQRYAFVCYWLSFQVLEMRLKDDSYIYYQAQEDNGNTIGSAFHAVRSIGCRPETMFRTCCWNNELNGKFHLEVLLVDAAQIGNDRLCREYRYKLDFLLESNYSVEPCLKKMIRKAEDWQASAKGKKNNENITPLLATVEESVSPTKKESENLPVDSSSEDSDTYLMAKFPKKGEAQEHWFVERMLIFNKENDIASMVMREYKKCWENQMAPNTYIMFEVRTLHENHIAVTKLRPYKEIQRNVIAVEISEQLQGQLYLISTVILTIYAADLPEFASVLKAPSLLNFIRKSLEMPLQLIQLTPFADSVSDIFDLCKERTGTYELEECTEPFEMNCNCQKLHLRDYCHFELTAKPNFEGRLIRRWLVRPTELSKLLYKNVHPTDLYARIVYRLIRNTFANVFDVNSYIYFDIFAREAVYTSRFYHHSEFELQTISKELSELMAAKTEMLEEFAIVVCVQSKLPTNAVKDLSDYLNRILNIQPKGEENTDVVVPENAKPVKSETSFAAENHGIISKRDSTQITKTLLNSSNKKGRDVLALRSRFFKKESELWKKAVILPLPTKDAYKIISSKTKINTTKGRITEFLVEPNRLFCEEMLNNSLLISYICLHIVKTTEISFGAGKKKKITMKLFYERTLVQSVLNENDCWNPESLKNDIFRERTLDITGQFQLEVLYRAK